MATPSEKLAESLEVLHKLQNANGAAAIRARDLTRTHRERLLKNGFLQEVMKGWYIPSRPDDGKGESTAWYASFWRFASAYLEHRFHKNWSLSPEQSLSIHVGNGTVPRQLAVRSPKGTNSVTKLPHGTSLFDLQAALPPSADRVERDGLRLYGLEAALIEASPRYFMHQATDARAALAMIRDASDLLGKLLDGGHSTIAGRLAGGFRNCGRDAIADEIIAAMTAAGYAMRESDPFSEQPFVTLPLRETSPYVNRIKLLWQKMRRPVIEALPHAPGLPRNKAAYMKGVEAAYVTDAYHSLSIEGYGVTASLIERVRSGSWNPEIYEQDHHRAWYREMFAPSVAVGLLPASELAGYRNGQVFIRNSMHVPLNREAVRDAMPAFFELLRADGYSAIGTQDVPDRARKSERRGKHRAVRVFPCQACQGSPDRFAAACDSRVVASKH